MKNTQVHTGFVITWMESAAALILGHTEAEGHNSTLPEGEDFHSLAVYFCVSSREGARL